jgi:hypothetical protein
VVNAACWIQCIHRLLIPSVGFFHCLKNWQFSVLHRDFNILFSHHSDALFLNSFPRQLFWLYFMIDLFFPPA